MDKYLKTFFSFQLVHFLMPVDNHNKLFSPLQAICQCLSIIRVLIRNTVVLHNNIFTGDIMPLSNKKNTKVMKQGNSNVIVLSQAITSFIGKDIKEGDEIEIKRNKTNNNKITITFLEKGLPNE